MHTLGGLRGNQVASFTEIGRDLRSFCSRASALFSLGTKRVNRDVAILLISDLKRSPLWKKTPRHLVESKECFDCSLVLQVSGLDSNVKIRTKWRFLIRLESQGKLKRNVVRQWGVHHVILDGDTRGRFRPDLKEITPLIKLLFS